MNHLRLCGALALGGCSSLPAAAAPAGPEILVVADARLQAAAYRPAPGQPVHYMILGGQEMDLGTPVPGVPVPDVTVLRRQLVKALAGQGYLPSKVGDPMPLLALAFSWGTASAMVDDSDDAAPDDESSFDGAVIWNRKEMARLVGSDKAGRHLLAIWESDQINQAFRSERVYLHIAAFDVAALAKKQRKLIWRTRISVDLRDGALPELFPRMLATAAPYFGRASGRPVFINGDPDRKTSVKVHDFEVIETLPDAPTPQAR